MEKQRNVFYLVETYYAHYSVNKRFFWREDNYNEHTGTKSEVRKFGSLSSLMKAYLKGPRRGGELLPAQGIRYFLSTVPGPLLKIDKDGDETQQDIEKYVLINKNFRVYDYSDNTELYELEKFNDEGSLKDAIVYRRGIGLDNLVTAVVLDLKVVVK